jgi:type I restriction enzyme R subunit
LLAVIAEKIRALTPPADVSAVMERVEGVLDRSIAAEGYVIRQPTEEAEQLIDLSRIDFKALKRKFQKGRKHTEAERLKSAITRKLQRLVRLNRTRVDYLEKFQHMIEEYNSGAINIEEFFKRLMTLAKELTEEEQRNIKESLTEEELTIFDLLTKPEMELTAKERKLVKKVARELLGTLKTEKLVLDWRKRQQSRAAVRLAIHDILDRLPERYTESIYEQKCQKVYQHVFESYFGDQQSVYVA